MVSLSFISMNPTNISNKFQLSNLELLALSAENLFELVLGIAHLRGTVDLITFAPFYTPPHKKWRGIMLYPPNRLCVRPSVSASFSDSNE